MSDTVASVVLIFDIFFLILSVKLLIRLIVMLGQIPPARSRTSRAPCAVDAPDAIFAERRRRDAPALHRMR